MSSVNVYEIVTERIIEQLEAGTAPWRKPWKASADGPRNIDGYRYRGVNVWLLLTEAQAHGYSSPYWMTFKQAKAKGGSVRKGEKSTVIVFWKRIRITDKETGEPKIIPMLRYFRVFNLDQTEDVKLPKRVAEEQAAVTEVELDPITEAEAIAAGYPAGPRVLTNGSEAVYQPGTDTVTVPPLRAYQEPGEYYSTLFHELGHSTGHKDRLDRFKGDQRFGSHDYGREELVAEMTSAFLAAEAGIETTAENSAAYLRGWIQVLREDSRAVVVAAGAAQRAAEHILGRTSAREADVELEKAA